MTDEHQHTTDKARVTNQTDDAQTKSETTDDEARLKAVEQRVEDHQAILDGLKEHLGGDGDGIGPVATRRGVLTAGGVLGLLGLGAGTASADPSGQVGTSNSPLNKLYTEELNGGVTGDQSLTDLTGSGLSINSGTLNASGASAWTDGSDNSNLLEPSDGTKTGIEDISKIRSNDNFTVDIDADANSGRDFFQVRKDIDGQAEVLLSVTEGGIVTLGAGPLDTAGHNITASGAYTVENTSGGLTLSTTNASDDIKLAPAGNVALSGGNLDVNGNDIEDSGTTIWDTSNSYIPTARLEYDSVTVTAGDGFKNGGTVSLGSSTTLDVEPADFAGTLLSDDGSDNLQVDEGSISHDNIDQTTVNTADHHTRPSAGTGLTEDGSNNFDIASGGVTGTEIDLSTIAGQNLTVDTTNDELDAQTPALAENDSDNLLETTGGEDGIDVTTIRVTNLDDTNGNGHLTLTGGGPLDLNQPLDTNGNGIQSNTSVSVDIDADGGGSGETFTVTKNGGGTTLLTVNQGGEVDVNSGNLDLNSNNVNNVASIDNGGSAISVDDALDVGGNAIQSTVTDSTLTITQDSNSTDATPEDLILETKDSSANNAVGNIVLDADTDNASPADIVFKTSTTERARVNGSGLNVDNLTDNGTGSVSMGNTLDLNGNKLTDNSGGLTIEGSSGNGVTINTDGGSRALELGVPSSAAGDTAGGNFVAGHPNNSVNNGAAGAVIGGGGSSGAAQENVVEDDYCVVAGGEQNQAGSTGSDETNAKWATVGGGLNNTASGQESTVAGGWFNEATANYATVAGGGDNVASGSDATVPGGYGNTASGIASFAAGEYAKAEDTNAFVWNDGSGAGDGSGGSSDQFSSSTSVGSTPTGTETFSVKATGGVRFVTADDNSSYAWISTSGNVEASGAKNFVETVDTEAGQRTVTYTSVEAPEVRTETSGIATVEDGVAVVDLDDHFAWVTDGDEPLVAQVTAHAEDPVTPRVTERSTDRIRIESDGSGPDIFEVSYTIKGIRQGYADKTVVSHPEDGTRPPSSDDDGTGPTSLRSETDCSDSNVTAEHTTNEPTDCEAATSVRDSQTMHSENANGTVSRRVEHLEAENEQLRERNAALEDRLAAVEAELGIDATAVQQGVADD